MRADRQRVAGAALGRLTDASQKPLAQQVKQGGPGLHLQLPGRSVQAQADGLAARVGRGVAHGRGLITVGRAMFSGTTGRQAQAFKLIDQYRLTIGQCAGAA